MEVIKEYWFLIMFVLGLVVSLVKSLYDLGKTISKLFYSIERLNESISNVQKDQEEAKGELKAHANQISNHETRITVLEKTGRD